MFFLAAKILGALSSPSNLFVLAVLCAGCALYSRFARAGRAVLIVVTFGFFACGFGPVGTILMRPLEDRFTRSSPEMGDPTGLIVLGGAIDPVITQARGSVALTADGGRITEAAALALHYPNSRVVYSGGSPNILSDQVDEATPAQRLFIRLGIDADRIVLESRARNTFENAVYTRNLVKPSPGQRWLLVTSAAHMPRAMGTFRRSGFFVVPYPTSYTTTGRASDFWEFHSDASAGLTLTDAAIHEWIGLLAYWLTGKTDTLLPGPTNETTR